MMMSAGRRRQAQFCAKTSMRATLQLAAAIVSVISQVSQSTRVEIQEPPMRRQTINETTTMAASLGAGAGAGFHRSSILDQQQQHHEHTRPARLRGRLVMDLNHPPGLAAIGSSNVARDQEPPAAAARRLAGPRERSILLNGRSLVCSESPTQLIHQSAGGAGEQPSSSARSRTAAESQGEEPAVSLGARVVLSLLLATVLLVVGATLFDCANKCGRRRKRSKAYADDIHSQVSEANTESMLIHETDYRTHLQASSIGGASDGNGSTSGRAGNCGARRLVKQIFLSFSFCHSFGLIFQDQRRGGGSSSNNNNSGNKTARLEEQRGRQHHHYQQLEQQHHRRQSQLSIDSLHGLRFLSMIWIIIIHTYSFAFRWSFFTNDTSENLYKTAASQLIANGAFACDSFFLIGGFLLPYLTFPAYSSSGNGSGSGSGSGGGSSRGGGLSNRIRNMSQRARATTTTTAAAAATKTQQLNNTTNKQQPVDHEPPAATATAPTATVPFKFTLTRLLVNLLHRYLRMMPLMMAIIGLSATLLRYLGEGPAWDNSTEMYDQWCRKNWWINALFLHNFLDRQNMCLSHSWYAAVDIQLFLLGQIILFVLAKSKRSGILICCLFLFGGQLLTALISLAYHLPALPLHASISPQSVSLYYGEIYIKPYCRASPYLIGILLAYLMRTTSLGQVKLRRWQNLLGWTVSLASLLVILLSTLPAMNGKPPGELESALYNALSRPLWACATGWLVFACITKHGGPIERLLSAPQFVPFSRLSYSAFLIHPIVMAISIGGRQNGVPFSHYLMLCLVLGNIVITYASAFVLSALFELPVLSVERAIKRSWRRTHPGGGSSCQAIGSDHHQHNHHHLHNHHHHHHQNHNHNHNHHNHHHHQDHHKPTGLETAG